MDILVLAGNILFGAGKKVLHGIISKRYLVNLADYYAGNGILFLFMTLSYLPFALLEPFPSWISVLLAVLNGLGNVFFQVFCTRAMNVGSVSLTVLITSFSLVPPILFSLFAMNETLSIFQGIGFALLALTFILVVKPDKEAKVNLKWLLFTGIAYTASAACGIIGKLRVLWVCDESIYWFLIIGSAISTGFALLMSNSTIHRQSLHLSFKLLSPATLLLFLCAVILAVNNICGMYCNILIPGTILFPVSNGGIMVLTMAATALVFRERLSGRQWAGIGAGVASLLLICNVIAA